MGSSVKKADEKRQYCSYYDALAAIGLMKGLVLVDVARDDTLVDALMAMDRGSVRCIVERYNREEHGYPTAEKISALAGGNEQMSSQSAPPAVPASEDALATALRQPVLRVQTIPPARTMRDRLREVWWATVAAVSTAVATTLVMSLTPIPWMQRLAWRLLTLPGILLDMLLAPDSVAFVKEGASSYVVGWLT